MEKLFKHSETEYDFISHDPINIDDKVQIGWHAEENRPLYKTVTGIIEQRPSGGSWGNKPVPTWYKLNTTPIAFTV